MFLYLKTSVNSKDNITLWKTVELLKIDSIAIYSNRISKFTECTQFCLIVLRQTSSYRLLRYKNILFHIFFLFFMLCSFFPLPIVFTGYEFTFLIVFDCLWKGFKCGYNETIVQKNYLCFWSIIFCFCFSFSFQK